jgi:hypothetical protein
MDNTKQSIDYFRWILDRQLILFFIKTTLVLIMASIAMFLWGGLIGQSISKSIGKSKGDEGHQIAKIYLKGLIQNPEAFVIAAEINSSRNRDKDAAIDLRMAIALAEVNHMDSARISRYKKLLSDVNRDIELNSRFSSSIGEDQEKSSNK